MKKTFIALIIICLLPVCSWAADKFVSFEKGDWQLNAGGKVSVYLSQNDQKGVSIAVNNLCKDIKAVCNADVKIVDSPVEANIIVGTVGSVKAVGDYQKQLKGKTEMYIIDARDNKLYIAGSDRRATIFGIYELSQQIGVSPWYWWADAPIIKHDAVYINNGVYTDGEPAVRYRGIFLNDEAPCLTTWVKNTFGTNYGGHEFYAKVFELILRLKGNMMWPAMWSWAFYADDPDNSKTADEMGIIMGTSHHEPMARNHQEYARKRGEWGAWNYNINKENLDRFFREGIERAKNTDGIITIGMRGDGDEAMSAEADTRLLETIVKNQRQIIKDVTKRPAKDVPQVWALYKEVQDYYDAGMRVPDDVIMLLCDDNWGDIRRVPNAKERKHKGGWGMYYHVDYVGAPRNTKWLNVTQTQQMHEQLTLTYDFGIDKLWILNVGDLKPMEYPITLFMDMAWNPKEYSTPTVKQHTVAFFKQNLGDDVPADVAQAVAEVYNTNCKYAARVTAEMLDMNTFNLENGEWRTVRDNYALLEREALRIMQKMPISSVDFYRQLVLFPVQAMANLYDMYFAQAMNHSLAKAGNKEADRWAQEVRDCFKRDSVLCAEYNNNIANGKWNGMMIQKHIGYKTWNDDFGPVDVCPETLAVMDKPQGHVAQKPLPMRIVIDAQQYASAKAVDGTEWTIYPDYGRASSAVALTPYTQLNVTGAELNYTFRLPADAADEVTIHVITKSTLDFLNVGGHEYGVSVDGSEPEVVNMNKTLVDRQPYQYSVFYPTVASRIIDKAVKVKVRKTADGMHTLTITPRHAGIVFEQYVIEINK